MLRTYKLRLFSRPSAHFCAGCVRKSARAAAQQRLSRENCLFGIPNDIAANVKGNEERSCMQPLCLLCAALCERTVSCERRRAAARRFFIPYFSAAQCVKPFLVRLFLWRCVDAHTLESWLAQSGESVIVNSNGAINWSLQR